MKQPSFFIVGAPKTGTTAMSRYLAKHPDIFIPPQKELRYFDKDFRKNNKSLEEYLALFAPGKGKICGEGTPTYLYSKVAAQEIHQFNPDAKIIIMLREPVSLLYSFHSQLLFNGSSETIEDFRLALEAEADRKQGKRVPEKCKIPQYLYYRELVKFTEQIQRYSALFSSENIKIIIHDDFQSDLGKIYQETLDFLGVDPNFSIEFNKVNSNKTVKSRSLQQLLKYPPSKVLEIGKYFIPLPQSLRRQLLEGVKNRLKKLNTETAPRPPLDPDLEASLKQELAPEVEKLSNLIDRDLSHWTPN